MSAIKVVEGRGTEGNRLEARPRSTVLLTTSQRLVRDALSEGLAELGGVQVVGTARDALETIALAERHRPKVVVVSDDIGREQCLQATRTISERAPTCSVLWLVGNQNDETLIDAVEAGARGYLTRGVRIGELSEAIERLGVGSHAIPDAMMPRLLDRLVRSRSLATEGDALFTQLSAREREVLSLLADGASSEGIAQALVISKETARKHVQNILVKMGVRSRLEAVAYVLQDGRRSLLGSGR